MVVSRTPRGGGALESEVLRNHRGHSHTSEPRRLLVGLKEDCVHFGHSYNNFSCVDCAGVGKIGLRRFVRFYSGFAVGSGQHHAGRSASG